jgi:hypothetical protein
LSINKTQDKDGDQQPALEVGSTRLLVIPVLNEASGGFPFPLLPRIARLKEGFFTRAPNHVDNRSVSEVERPHRDGRHRTLCVAQSLRIVPVKAIASGLECGPGGAQNFRVREDCGCD